MSQSTRSIEETTRSAIYQSRKVYLGILLLAHIVQIDLVYGQSGSQDYAVTGYHKSSYATVFGVLQ